MLLFPVFVALQAIFTIGVALILATGTAFFRDVRHLVEVALAVLFWTTPIVYELNRLRGGLRQLILAQPDVAVRQRVPRHLLLPPVAGRGRSGRPRSATPRVALALGLWLIVRYEDSFAERV